MRGALVCVAMVGLALVLPGTAAARPFVDLTSLTPQNKKGQVLHQMRRDRPLVMVVGFRVSNAPKAAHYRLRVSLRLSRKRDLQRLRSKGSPQVYTGMYRFSLPITVKKRFAPGTYKLFATIQLLDGNRVVATDTRARGIRIR